MLWWRYYKKKKAIRKTEKRKEKNEASRKCWNSTRGIFICFKIRWL